MANLSLMEHSLSSGFTKDTLSVGAQVSSFKLTRNSESFSYYGPVLSVKPFKNGDYFFSGSYFISLNSNSKSNGYTQSLSSYCLTFGRQGFNENPFVLASSIGIIENSIKGSGAGASGYGGSFFYGNDSAVFKAGFISLDMGYQYEKLKFGFQYQVIFPFDSKNNVAQSTFFISTGIL